MAVTNYFTVDGEIIGESTNGVRLDYLADALGSVTATVDQTGTVQNTYRYKPYGALLAKTGTAPDPKFTWVGSMGYRSGGSQYTSTYIRARHFEATQANWTSIDSLWPQQMPYLYVNGMPNTAIDPSGLQCLITTIGTVGTAACSATCGFLCLSCNGEFRGHLDLNFAFDGCPDCLLYSWKYVNGVGTKDIYDDKGKVIANWPQHNYAGQSSANYSDSHGLIFKAPFCPTQSFSATFLTCLCCSGGSSCVTWAFSGKADGCANPKCDPDTKITTHVKPTPVSAALSAQYCRNAQTVIPKPGGK